MRVLSNDAAILTWLENQPMTCKTCARIGGQASDLDLLKIGWLHLAARFGFRPREVMLRGVDG
jgi:hypothetical protein